ncbi:MAG: hypothetical protein AB2747_05865 [Candidatus Thiodiazotropha taylori]
MDKRGTWAVVLVLNCLLFSTGLLAEYGSWDYKPRSGEVKFNNYNITQEEVIKATIDVVIQNNWLIVDNAQSDFTATYKERVKLKVTFKDDSVLLNEIVTNLKFEKRWMESLKKNIDQKFQYYHYVREMTPN